MGGSGDGEAREPLGGEVPILGLVIGLEGWLSGLGDGDLEMQLFVAWKDDSSLWSGACHQPYDGGGKLRY